MNCKRVQSEQPVGVALCTAWFPLKNIWKLGRRRQVNREFSVQLSFYLWEDSCGILSENL